MLDTTMENEDGTRESLSNGQIAAFGFNFFVAGTETTATVLSTTSYLLALHPDIQEKLQSEINDYFQDNPVVRIIDHDVKACRILLSVYIHDSQRYFCHPVLLGGWLSVRGCTEHRVLGHGYSGEHATLPSSCCVCGTPTACSQLNVVF